MTIRKYLAALSFVLLIAIVGPVAGLAGVNVNVNINAPLAPLALAAPPPVAPIPGIYAYFAPDVEVDIIFYEGSWYRPHEGRWYQADEYNGSWRPVPHDRVPSVLHHLPPNYRHTQPGQERISYSQVKKNWKTWEKEKHWDKRDKRRRHDEGREGASEHDHRRHDRRGHGHD